MSVLGDPEDLASSASETGDSEDISRPETPGALRELNSYMADPPAAPAADDTLQPRVSSDLAPSMASTSIDLHATPLSPIHATPQMSNWATMTPDPDIFAERDSDKDNSNPPALIQTTVRVRPPQGGRFQQSGRGTWRPGGGPPVSGGGDGRFQQSGRGTWRPGGGPPVGGGGGGGGPPVGGGGPPVGGGGGGGGPPVGGGGPPDDLTKIRNFIQNVRDNLGGYLNVAQESNKEIDRILAIATREETELKVRFSGSGAAYNIGAATDQGFADNMYFAFAGMSAANAEAKNQLTLLKKVEADIGKYNASIQAKSSAQDVKTEIAKDGYKVDNPLDSLSKLVINIIEQQIKAEHAFFGVMKSITGVQSIDSGQLKNKLDSDITVLNSCRDAAVIYSKKAEGTIGTLPDASSVKEFKKKVDVDIGEANKIPEDAQASAIFINGRREAVIQLHEAFKPVAKKFSTVFSDLGAFVMELKKSAQPEVLLDESQTEFNKFGTYFAKMKALKIAIGLGIIDIINIYCDFISTTSAAALKQGGIKLADIRAFIEAKKKEYDSDSALSTFISDFVLKMKAPKTILDRANQNSKLVVKQVQIMNADLTALQALWSAVKPLIEEYTRLNKAITDIDYKKDLAALKQRVEKDLVELLVSLFPDRYKSSLPKIPIKEDVEKMEVNFTQEKAINAQLDAAWNDYTKYSKEVNDAHIAVQTISKNFPDPTSAVVIDNIIQAMAGSRDMGDPIYKPIRDIFEKDVRKILDAINAPTPAKMMSLPLPLLAIVGQLTKNRAPSTSLSANKKAEQLINAVTTVNPKLQEIIREFEKYDKLPPAGAAWNPILNSLTEAVIKNQLDIERAAGIRPAAPRVISVDKQGTHAASSAIIVAPLQVSELTDPVPPEIMPVILKALENTPFKIDHINMDLLNVMIAGFMEQHPGMLSSDEAKYAVQVALSTKEWLSYYIRSVGNLLYERLHPEAQTSRHPIEEVMTRYRDSAVADRVALETTLPAESPASPPQIERYASYSVASKPLALPPNFATVIKGSVDGSPDTQLLIDTYAAYNARRNPETYSSLIDSYRRTLGIAV